MRAQLSLLFVVGLVAAAWLDARAYVRAFCEGASAARPYQSGRGGDQVAPPSFSFEIPSNDV